METAELFNASERASLYRYLSTRFNWQVVVALPCLLVVLALVAKKNWEFSSAIVSILVALTLIVPFRLADDLADRKRDRLRYPDRELCKTEFLQSYLIALVFLLSVAALAVFTTQGMFAVKVFGTAVSIVALWYMFRERIKASPMLNYHVVLSKYIAFELILIAPVSGRSVRDGWWSALTAYMVLLLWEVIHDETNRRSATTRGLAMIEFSVWLGWTLWLAL